jgi:nitronate monooxygenase
MAGAAGGKLAAAVSQAGALGLIGGGYGDRAWIEAQFDEAGDAGVGCGLITWALQRSPGVLEAVLERRPRALFLSFGDPRPFSARVVAAGVPLICQVHNRADATLAIDAGADVIVAQGSDAGGHGDLRRGTFSLVPEIADLLAVRAPNTLLCAAGGVADGRGLAAAIALGADGVLVGSRLWATREAAVSDAMHSAAIGANGDDTVRTSVMDIVRELDWPARFTARVLRNRFTQSWHGREPELRAMRDQVSRDWIDGWAVGDPERANTFVGEAVGLIDTIDPAAVLIERMGAQGASILGRD